MKRTTSVVTSALVVVCMLLMLPAPVLATPPEPLTIDAYLWVDPQDFSCAEGTFVASDLLNDGGDASEVFFIDYEEGTIHGVKTLEGAEGTITIKFQAQLTFNPDGTGEAVGRFVIVSGTGAYEKLHGVGSTSATLNLGAYPDPQIVAHYTGTAHFD